MLSVQEFAPDEPVIVSASRRTDIPAFYGQWFIHALEKGEVAVKNPFGGRNRAVSFARSRVFVFWTKNPGPFLPVLEKLGRRKYNYYVQFTLNDYEAEGLEPGLPSWRDRIETCRQLSNGIGKSHIVWRFDPLILTGNTDCAALLEKVEQGARALEGCVDRLVVSFAKTGAHAKVRRNLARAGKAFRDFTPDELVFMAEGLAGIGREHGLRVMTCAEPEQPVDFRELGLEPSRCIDDRLLRELFPEDRELMRYLDGYATDMARQMPGFEEARYAKLKDKGQRPHCGCIKAVDIGAYNTCPHGCLYCYANADPIAVQGL